MFGEIYPWAGQWRTVTLRKAGITWDVPPYGMEIAMKNFACAHPHSHAIPFRRSRGCARNHRPHHRRIPCPPSLPRGERRSAFLMGEILLVQNGLLPFDRHQRQRDQTRYYSACESARTRYDYSKLTDLFIEWQGEAQGRFQAENPGR